MTSQLQEIVSASLGERAVPIARIQSPRAREILESLGIHQFYHFHEYPNRGFVNLIRENLDDFPWEQVVLEDDGETLIRQLGRNGVGIFFKAIIQREGYELVMQVGGLYHRDFDAHLSRMPDAVMRKIAYVDRYTKDYFWGQRIPPLEDFVEGQIERLVFRTQIRHRPYKPREAPKTLQKIAAIKQAISEGALSVADIVVRVGIPTSHVYHYGRVGEINLPTKYHHRT